MDISRRDRPGTDGESARDLGAWLRSQSGDEWSPSSDDRFWMAAPPELLIEAAKAHARQVRIEQWARRLSLAMAFGTLVVLVSPVIFLVAKCVNWLFG